MYTQNEIKKLQCSKREAPKDHKQSEYQSNTKKLCKVEKDQNSS